MKLSTEKILKKIEELDNYEIRNFIFSLDLTPEQMEFLADHENEDVRWGLAQNPNLPDKVMVKLSSDRDRWVRRWLAENPKIIEKVMIKLSSDEDVDVRYWLAGNPNLTEELMVKLSSDENYTTKNDAFEKLKKLNYLSSEELESAYDLINNSKHIGSKNFEKTFDYIAKKFPELSELAKMFKRIILKGKKDLK